MQSILSRAHKQSIQREPFPHIIGENALEKPLYASLAGTFPSTGVIAGNKTLKNQKMGLNAVNLLKNNAISQKWQDFIAYHSSPEFFSEVLDIFGDEIRALYPFLEKDFRKPLTDLNTTRRITAERKTTHRSDEVVLDCQVMVDDTSDPRICRGPLVDAVEEIFSGLLYFRHPEDQSNGGDLCVLRAKDSEELFPHEGAIRVDQRPAEIEDAKTEIVTLVPYAENTAIFFINSPKSLHKVTMRTASPIPRRHVNFIGESYSLNQGGLFQILKPGVSFQPAAQSSLIRRAMNKLRRSF